MSPGFSSPPDPIDFNTRVWELVCQVPPGHVVTYGQIASQIAAPAGMAVKDYRAFGARWVGGAMAHCPPGVPWQRVINAQGKVSIRPGSGGQQQRQLLEAEGVVFDERDRVDLARFGYKFPSEQPEPPEQPSLF